MAGKPVGVEAAHIECCCDLDLNQWENRVNFPSREVTLFRLLGDEYRWFVKALQGSSRCGLVGTGGGPHDDLVDVHLGGLPNGERDGIGDRRCRNGKGPVFPHCVAGLFI